MSVRQSLLALLQEGPRYGYQLRAQFEASTGGTWPLNVGQVYTTLARLERDGLIEAVEGDNTSGQAFYRLTNAGAAEAREWFASPVGGASPPRDELAIKLALAVTVPGINVTQVIQTQRTSTLKVLQQYTRLKSQSLNAGSQKAETPQDLAWLLVVDSLIFAAEAEVRWLDHCETRLVRAAASGAPLAATAADAAADAAETTEVLS